MTVVGVDQREYYLECHRNCGLKIGDTVRIVKEANSYERGWGTYWTPDMTNSVGKAAKITRDHGINGFSLDLPKCNDAFPFFVLEKVETQNKKEKTMEYKYEAGEYELSLESLLDDDEVCVDWKDKLIKDFGKEYGYSSRIPVDVAVEYAKKNNVLEWLVDNAYLERKEKAVHRIGNYYRLHHKFGGLFDGRIYLLANADAAGLVLVETQSGGRWNDPLSVKNINQLTQDEWQRISHEGDVSFELIEVEIKEKK